MKPEENHLKWNVWSCYCNHNLANGLTGYPLDSRDYRGKGICGRIGHNNGPELNMNPNKALKLIANKARPKWFISKFESYMVEEMFPALWMEQKLPKPPEPSSMTFSADF